MTISVIQEKQVSTGGGFSNSLSLAFTSAITAGSAIHAIFQYNGAVQTVNFADNNGNTWPAGTLDNFNDPGNSSTCHQVLNNANAGATTITATITGSSTNFLCLWIKEIGGAATTGSPDGHNGVNSTSTTSQNISATNANQPALISILVNNDNTQEVPVLDASLTPSSANPGWNYGGSINSTLCGHKRITTTGVQTITNTQASADSLNAVMAIFKEAAGSGTTLTAASGTYTYTGEAATLTASSSFSMTAASGSYSLTGKPATLVNGAVLSANFGTYSLNGQAATLSATQNSFTLIASAGAYDLTGASSSSDIQTDVAAGSYGLTGQSVTFSQGTSGPTLNANFGTYTMNGVSATLTAPTVVGQGAPMMLLFKGAMRYGRR